MGDAVPPTSGPSEWHSIRPWTPHVKLSVREITSVSATFILSSSLDAQPDEPEPELDNDTHDAISESGGIIADAVSHGLSVDVNGSKWQRVILRVDDHADEVIIVIYGLHPGRQYDIDLALVSGGTMRRQVTTEDADGTAVDDEREDDHHHHAIVTPECLSTATTATVTTGNECASPIPSPCQTPAPEERMRTLSHQLNALHAEQASLQASLKSVRRDASKTSTGLRADIDGLRRASEKAGALEGKARQRVRALEDAVRRANEGREEVEQLTVAHEHELDGLRARLSEAEEILRTVKKEADATRAEREKQEEEGRKRQESMRGECASLSQKLERLTVKKERLENSVVPDLEAQLTEIEREIEIVERDGFQNGDTWDSLQGDPSRTETHLRHQSYPGTIGRPPGQRTSQPPISPPHLPLHQPRSQSVYRIHNHNELGSVGLAHPPGLGHAPLHCSSSSMGASGVGQTVSTAPFSQSTPTSLSRSTSSVSSSTLSGKAPPFEPTRKLRVSLSSPGNSGFPSGGMTSIGNQGSFSPSSSTFSTAGSTLAVSGAYSPSQRTSGKGHDADLGSNQAWLANTTEEGPWDS